MMQKMPPAGASFLARILSILLFLNLIIKKDKFLSNEYNTSCKLALNVII